MTCESCGRKMKAVEKRYTEEGDIYRRFVCQGCGYEAFSIEYEVEQTDGFVEAWKTARHTMPRGGGDE